MSDIKLDRKMTSHANKLRKLADGVVDAKRQAQEGFSTAQEDFAKESALIGTEFSPEVANAIFESIVGENGERKSKASEAKKFGHPNVAPHVESLFKKAREDERLKDVSNSVVARVSKMATVLKEGTATSVASAADQVCNKAKQDAEKAATPKGAKERATKSVKGILKKAGYSDADVAPIVDAITALGEPTEAVKPEPAEPATPDVGEALQESVSPDEDADLKSLFAQMMQQNQAMMAALSEKL